MTDISGRPDVPGSGAGISVRVVAAYAIGVALLLGLVELQPRTGADVAVLAPPWSSPSSAAAIVAGADGDIVGGTRWPFVIVAHARTSQFVAAAYAKGAWFVFDAGVLAGCRQPKAGAAPQ